MEQKNMVLGTLMAVLLGLVGCVVWGVLYYLEVIAGLAAFLIIFLAGVGYKKFGKVKYLDKKDYLILVVISLVELVLTFLVCYGIMVKSIYADLGITISFIDGIKEMFALASENAELKSAIISDVIFSLVFMAVGIFAYIRNEKRKKQREEVLSQVQGGGYTQNPNVTITPYVDENSVQQNTNQNTTQISDSNNNNNNQQF